MKRRSNGSGSNSKSVVIDNLGNQVDDYPVDAR